MVTVTLFQEGSESYCLFTLNGEAVLPQIVAFQLWIWKTGAAFPDLSSVFIYLEHLDFLKLYITLCIGCEFCLYAYMICSGRHIVFPFLRGILYLWKGTYSWNIWKQKYCAAVRVTLPVSLWNVDCPFFRTDSPWKVSFSEQQRLPKALSKVH